MGYDLYCNDMYVRLCYGSLGYIKNKTLSLLGLFKRPLVWEHNSLEDFFADEKAYNESVKKIPKSDPIFPFYASFLSESLSDPEKCKVLLPKLEELYEKWPEYEVKTENQNDIKLGIRIVGNS